MSSGCPIADVPEGLLMMLGMDHHNRTMGWWMGGWGWLWVILVILVCVAVIALIVWAISRAGRGGASPPDRTAVDALSILEDRFARGEIDQDEFERRRAELRNDGP